MDPTFVFGVLALGLNIIAEIPYLKGIIQGTVKPQRISWGIWSILTSIGFVNQVANGGGYSSLFLGSTAVLVATIFVLSLRKGVGGGSTFDRIILVTAGALFVYWAFSSDVYYSTLIAVTIARSPKDSRLFSRRPGNTR